MKKNNKIILSVAVIALLIVGTYSIILFNPKLVHKKHEYMGYTYYSSIFDRSFEEFEAEYAFDSLLGEGTDTTYKYILDGFYEDGYSLFFDDKFTYALCTRDFTHSNDFSACVIFDRDYKRIREGMFINYKNDYFSPKIFYHELAHYVDYSLGLTSKSTEFEAIKEAEYGSSTLKDSKYHDDIMEYFAEETAYYIIEKITPSGVFNEYGKYKDAPMTFDYIASALEKYKRYTESSK